MELLLPDKDLMPLGHISECTDIMNQIDDIRAIINNSDMDEERKETADFSIIVNRRQQDAIEMALLIYKRILIQTHRDEIKRRV